MSELENSSQCFSCGKGLQHIDGFPVDHCAGATRFVAPGNYGSGLWDPGIGVAGREQLVINICDGCLEMKSPLVLMDRITRFQPVSDFEQWNPKDMCTST